MKPILMAVLLLVAMPILVLCQTNQNDKTANELMQFERDWVTATLKRDKAWLERFFADEFISTHPTSGTIKNKAQEIADTVDAAQTPESSTLGEMKVIVTGKMAIVTGAAFEVGGAQHLTDRKRGYLFTDTFIRRSGRWQILASHSSRLPETEISAAARQEIERAILKIENEWTQMFVSREFSHLEILLADDYVGSDIDSRRTKAEEIAGYKAITDRAASATIENVKTHVFTKDAAIVTGELVIKGKDKGDKEFNNRYRFTDTYVKRNGIWQCVAAHATQIK